MKWRAQPRIDQDLTRYWGALGSCIAFCFDILGECEAWSLRERNASTYPDMKLHPASLSMEFCRILWGVSSFVMNAIGKLKFFPLTFPLFARLSKHVWVVGWEKYQDLTFCTYHRHHWLHDVTGVGLWFMYVAVNMPGHTVPHVFAPSIVSTICADNCL